MNQEKKETEFTWEDFPDDGLMNLQKQQEEYCQKNNLILVMPEEDIFGNYTIH